jgi:hypothetical protein
MFIHWRAIFFQKAVERVRWIRKLLGLGLSLEDIRLLAPYVSGERRTGKKHERNVLAKLVCTKV